MAASGGRQLGIISSRIRFCLGETLGVNGLQRFGSSQIGVAPFATLSMAGAAFQFRGWTEFRTEQTGSGRSFTAWRKFDTVPHCGRGIVVRNASTSHKSPEAASKEEGVHGDQKQTNTHDGETKSTSDEKEEEVVDEKTQTLRAALLHVSNLGWTEAALVAGARDVGLSPAFAGAFPEKEAALVEFFMDECTQALVAELESREEQLGKLALQDRIATIVWTRLQMQVPYLTKWAQALSIQANPVNLPTTIKQRALLMDEIWHAAGDQSKDLDSYTKLAVMAGVYSTTELYMITDISPGFQDTQAFLERRIKDALDCRKTAEEAGHFAKSISSGLQKTLDAFLNRARPPSGSGFQF